MSIAHSPEERQQAEAKIAGLSDEQLRNDLAYWSVAAGDHQDRYAELGNERERVTEQYREAHAWVSLIITELQKRRPKPAGAGELLS